MNAGEWSSVFAVPCGVVDKYIRLASGNSLKLLMFLLRHGGESFSDDTLKEKLGFREAGELEDAAYFWIQRGVIRFDKEQSSDEENALVPSAEKPLPLRTAQLTLDEIETKPKADGRASSLKKISSDTAYVNPSEIAGRVKTDPQIKYLFDEAQKLYAKPITQSESQMIIGLVDNFGLPPMVAAMLLNYCFRIGKTGKKYISTVAQGWADEEITTVELADARISAMEKQNGIEERIKEAMEMKSRLTPENRRFIRTWTEDWGFGEDMIMMAYDITVNATGKMSFPYANKILESWNMSGVRTRDAAEQAIASHKSSAAKGATASNGAASGSSFDMDDVMNQIKKRYSKQS